MHVAAWIVVCALAGWLAAKTFVPRAWVAPPAPPTESSATGVEWSLVDTPYGEVTGVTTLDGPVLLGRFGALTFPGALDDLPERSGRDELRPHVRQQSPDT